MARGCQIGRNLQYYIGAPVADASALASIAVGDARRVNGCITVKLDDNTAWIFLSSSSAAAGPSVVVPGSGSGRFHAAAGGATGAGLPKVLACRYSSTGALAAYTRTGNTILADANGALGAIDGVTGAVGETFLLMHGAGGADNGPYRLDAIGAAGSKFQMTRVGDADASAEVVAGMLVYVSEGTANGNEWYFLSTDDAITLNTTALTFTQLPPLADMQSADTSLTTRVSTEESTRSDADASLTTRVSTEESTRSDAVASIDTAFSTADASLTTRVSTEESTRSDADASLTTRVSTEESTRSDADASLTTRVSTEESTRSDAVASIDTRVSTVEPLALKLLATATITSADLTAVGVGPEIENVGAVTVDNAIPMAVRAKLTDAFDNGAGVSLTMTIGWNGAANQFVTAFDCYTGSALEGTGWESGTRNAEPMFGFPSGSTQFVAGFTAGADTLANFTNGSVTIEVWGLEHS